MKIFKQNILLFASSVFFLPSFFNDQPQTQPVFGITGNESKIIFSSYKDPIPNISGWVTFETLSQEEMEIYFPKPEPVPTPTSEELESWFTHYANIYNVSAETLKNIAYCESHYNPQATNGIYGGMFQYSLGTWNSTRNAMGENPDPSLRFDAEESIKTTAFKISVGGIGAWPNCSR